MAIRIFTDAVAMCYMRGIVKVQGLIQSVRHEFLQVRSLIQKRMRRCEHCMTMFQQPRVTCEDLFGCVAHGGTLFAMSQEGDLSFRWEADVLCLPTMNTTEKRAIVFATGLQPLPATDECFGI